jgi:hypothetical protein
MHSQPTVSDPRLENLLKAAWQTRVANFPMAIQFDCPDRQLNLVPTPGTRYHDCQPSAVTDVAAILAEVRLCYPDKPICLGCMRPKGRCLDELDL